MCNNNRNKCKDIKNNKKSYQTSLLTSMINQRLSRACIVHLVIKRTNWSYVKTMSCSGNHLGIPINIKNTKFVKNNGNILFYLWPDIKTVQLFTLLSESLHCLIKYMSLFSIFQFFFITEFQYRFSWKYTKMCKNNKKIHNFRYHF